MRRESWSYWLLPALALLVLAGTLGYVALARGQLPAGPTPVVWDRAACATCRMHVGEPAFAAQAQLRDGSTLFFDDAGCLLGMLPDIEPQVHALWFHHVREDRWVRGDAVGFVAVSPSPMGFDLGAVDGGEPGAESLAASRARLAARWGGR
ncbi:MAG: hypothetical protein R3F56_12140 [Planctomycetota bacterium]